jgi:hypothetical protein
VFGDADDLVLPEEEAIKDIGLDDEFIASDTQTYSNHVCYWKPFIPRCTKDAREDYGLKLRHAISVTRSYSKPEVNNTGGALKVWLQDTKFLLEIRQYRHVTEGLAPWCQPFQQLAIIVNESERKRFNGVPQFGKAS